MQFDNFIIQKSFKKEGLVKLKQMSMNELIILLPLSGFTIKVDTPLFSIKGTSPGEVTLIGITNNQFEIQITTPDFSLTTLVPSLVLEIIDPEGNVIIRIVAPPE